MNVTRDLISDLLPAYLSGEASADTRAFVEEAAAHDPAIARLVESARVEGHLERSASMQEQVMSLPPDLDRETVNRTRQSLRRRSVTLNLALLTTLIPFTFAFDGHRVVSFMMRDQPESRLLWIAAAALWFEYARLSRRLRFTPRR